MSRKTWALPTDICMRFGGLAPVSPEAPVSPWPGSIAVSLVNDLGFAGTSIFGGPVGTPTFEQIASEGLAYNNFHTTAVRSRSRAC